MDKEIADAANISVELVLIAAFLALVVFTVIMGNGIRVGAGNEMSSTVNRAEEATLDSLAYDANNIVPAAAALNVCLQSESLVDGTDCRVCGRVCGMNRDGTTDGLYDVFPGACLKSHLDGKVSFEVDFEESTGHYYITVHKPGCTWQSGTCTCPGH